MKVLLSVDELVEHMKNKGITFREVSEAEAKSFLSNNNYYMKLAAYRANYDKRKTSDEYINLDFAYLQELSTIDMHLRYLILQMCLDVEHALKTRLLSDIENNPEEDGYDEFIGSEVVKKRRFKQLQEFVDGRMVKNKDYFDKNECIKTAYSFAKKVVDFVNDLC